MIELSWLTSTPSVQRGKMMQRQELSPSISVSQGSLGAQPNAEAQARRRFGWKIFEIKTEVKMLPRVTFCCELNVLAVSKLLIQFHNLMSFFRWNSYFHLTNFVWFVQHILLGGRSNHLVHPSQIHEGPHLWQWATFLLAIWRCDFCLLSLPCNVVTFGRGNVVGYDSIL